ncbi:MAG: EF-hand domain-containing protein [Opitutaceae bacterium]|nr:EF-hand domain-containing protein [Opitutaceae bacterium]
MKSKFLVLTLAPAMLIATAALVAADDAADAPSGKPTAKHHEEMIARFDKDGDGKLNEEEMAAAKAAAAERRGEMHDAALQRFDANGDGKLDDTERATAREAMKANRGAGLTDEQRAKARAEFEAYAAKYDKDGDGKLSAAERKAAREAWAAEHPEAAAKLREAADKDGDGVVSDKERRAAAREMRKKQHKKNAGEAGATGE